MKMVRLVMLVAAVVFVVTSAQAVEFNDRAEAGLEYRVGTGDGDDALGVYANYEIDLPEPVSLVIGAGYHSNDYEFKEFSGSYDAFCIELLLRLSWKVDQWRPYVGAGGAQYFFSSFDEIDVENKLGLIAECGSYLQITDNLRINMALRYATLQPHNVNPEIGTMELDSIVLRGGVVFDF